MLACQHLLIHAKHAASFCTYLVAKIDPLPSEGDVCIMCHLVVCSEIFIENHKCQLCGNSWWGYQRKKLGG